MAWYCHLEETLSFPFEARVRQTLAASPLRVSEQVCVTGLAHDQLCRFAIFVRAQHYQRDLVVPLAQLVPLRANQSTRSPTGTTGATKATASEHPKPMRSRPHPSPESPVVGPVWPAFTSNYGGRRWG
ncbi:calcium-binding protein [Cupriavidus necator]|uniref:calcium-binding protein n=1 Tax=Cupriavidus necator TaxID=106590 RepID=UPI001E2F92B4|nr:calcium-binding protein [Cupriavidus necator]